MWLDAVKMKGLAGETEWQLPTNLYKQIALSKLLLQADLYINMTAQVTVLA